jgi:hypothetical protein
VVAAAAAAVAASGAAAAPAAAAAAASVVGSWNAHLFFFPLHVFPDDRRAPFGRRLLRGDALDGSPRFLGRRVFEGAFVFF